MANQKSIEEIEERIDRKFDQKIDRFEGTFNTRFHEILAISDAKMLKMEEKSDAKMQRMEEKSDAKFEKVIDEIQQLNVSSASQATTLKIVVSILTVIATAIVGAAIKYTVT